MANTANANGTVTLHAQCHCRRQTFTLPVPRSRLPLRAETCHCDDCRQITGLLANDYVILRDILSHDIFDPDSLPVGLRAFSPGSVTWYFCQACGCHLLQSSKKNVEEARQAEQTGRSKHKWYVSTGILYPLQLPDELGGGRVFERQSHSFVRPGRDRAGLAHFMPDGLPRYAGMDSDGPPLPAEAHDRTDPQPGPTAAEQQAIEAASKADSLPIRCRCGYVRLRLQRVSAHPLKPELRKSITNAKGDKYICTICTCNSCRTANGFEGGAGILFSTYHHITNDNDDDDAGQAVQQATHTLPPGYDPQQLAGDAEKPATVGLCTYESSDAIRRRFCPGCGATILLDFTAHGPEICDLFVGVINAPYRALWSSWTEMHSKLIFLDYCRDRQLAQTLNEGVCPGVDCTLPESRRQSVHGYKGELIL